MADEPKPPPVYPRITVKSLLKPATDLDGDVVHQVALWDVHAQHPGGEVWLAGPEEIEVAETPVVLEAIRDQRIIRVEGRHASAPAAPAGKPKE